MGMGQVSPLLHKTTVTTDKVFLAPGRSITYSSSAAVTIFQWDWLSELDTRRQEKLRFSTEIAVYLGKR